MPLNNVRISRKWLLLRRTSQTLFLLFFVYILWSTTYPLKGPFSPEILFRIDPLIIFFTSISERVLIPGLALSGAIILLTLVLGRFFCGWICPLGATLDLAGCAGKKSEEEDDATNARLGKPKFFILAALALFAFAGIQVVWVLDPIGIMARLLSFNSISSNSIYVFFPFLIVCALLSLKKRAWCRMLCPLGALYALAAKFSILRRTVRECKDCKRCKSRCRMGAIRDDRGYSKGECILCMDCLYDCPETATSFAWRLGDKTAPKGTDESRRNLLLLICSSLFLTGFGRFKMFKRDLGRTVIRPPAALKEDEFIDRCIRCGNCMRACITNGLQPVILEAGLQGIWTPRLVPEIGYCAYNCTLCGNTCPTGAIRRVSLDKKHDTRLGLAVVDRSRCISWSENRDCMVCEEHCPIPDKAIKAKEDAVGDRIVRKPLVDGSLCVGCGLCQNKCPTLPVRAIRVSPF